MYVRCCFPEQSRIQTGNSFYAHISQLFSTQLSAHKALLAFTQGASLASKHFAAFCLPLAASDSHRPPSNNAQPCICIQSPGKTFQLLVQPCHRIVLFGQWLQLFQLSLNEGAFNYSLKTAIMPTSFNEVWLSL